MRTHADPSEYVKPHLQHCRAAGYAERTIHDRHRVLRRVIHDLGSGEAGLLHATTDQLAAWLGRPGWSPQTRATYYGHINGLLAWAVDQGVITANPMTRLRKVRVPRRTPRPARSEAFREVLRIAQEPYRLAAILAGFQGLRAHEIAALRREDVTAEHLTVWGKGGRMDVLPTHRMVWSAVRNRPPGILVLSPTRRRPYPAADLSRAFAAYLRELGVDGVTLHPLRHLFATSLLRRGVNIRVVQELCRHASLSTTAGYLEVTDVERRAAIDGLPDAA